MFPTNLNNDNDNGIALLMNFIQLIRTCCCNNALNHSFSTQLKSYLLILYVIYVIFI